MNKPPTTKTSRYGKSINRVPLRERYEEQLIAPDLLSLRDENALLISRLNDLLSRLDEKAIDFAAMLALHQELETYIKLGDLALIQTVSSQMSELINKGLAEAEIFREVYQIVEHRRKLVETEMKTIHTIGSMLSAEQFMTLLSKVVAALTLHVSDKTQLAAVHGEINRLLDLVPTSNGGFSTVVQREKEKQSETI